MQQINFDSEINFNSEQIFENIDDGLLVLKKDTVMFTNSQYRRLWGMTRFFQRAGAVFKPYDEEVDVLVKTRSFGHRTLQVNVGSAIRYYYLYLFPLNSDYFVIVSRDITEQYVEHSKNKEFTSLFHTLFQTTPTPVALIDCNGRIDRMNPLFFNTLDSNTTIVNGSFIWDLFGDDRPKIKELVEELLDNKTTVFEEQDFRFIKATGSWILVYRKFANFCSIHEDSIEYSAEILKIAQAFQDFEAFIRVLKWLGDLPWKTLIALAIGAAVIFGGATIKLPVDFPFQQENPGE
ncbi:MAG: PAS domain-containing protein [Prochlorotrichaceae cyanobacterium]